MEAFVIFVRFSSLATFISESSSSNEAFPTESGVGADFAA
jgi:hypothetical protein